MESLRVTLQKLEQTTDSSPEAQDIAELKQILLNRMAELEALSAMAPAEAESSPSSPSDLPPLAVTTDEEGDKSAMDATPLEKLD
ncbi:MAG: hypothetical protein WBQ95_15325 [Terracidiphilus sp.]